MKVALSALALSVVLCGSVVAAAAQSAAAPAAGSPGAGPRDPYITSTGETVDRPGRSQSAGTTPADRRIQRENNAIDNSICKGC